MIRKPILTAIAISAFIMSGAILNSETANSAPGCLDGVSCAPQVGSMHKPHSAPGQPGMQSSGDNHPSGDSHPMHWRHRNHGYSNDNVGFGIYVNQEYGYNGGWHHRQHCRMVKVWRHHHRVWVKRCYWPR